MFRKKFLSGEDNDYLVGYNNRTSEMKPVFRFFCVAVNIYKLKRVVHKKMAPGSLAISKKKKRFHRLCHLASYEISISTTANYLKNLGKWADFSLSFMNVVYFSSVSMLPRIGLLILPRNKSSKKVNIDITICGQVIQR